MNDTEPLGLPRGSVRAAITCALVAISGLMLFVPVAKGADDVKAMFVLLTGIAVRDYFAHRSEQNAQDGPPLPAPYVRD